MAKIDFWLKNYYYAKKYYEEHGNLFIPLRYQFIDEEGNVVKLGFWLANQKQYYKKNKLDGWKLELLENIGFVLESRKQIENLKWNEKYELAKKYYEEHGDLIIPASYECVDEEGNIVKLGIWLITQRYLYKNNQLSEERIEKLNNLNMIWKLEEHMDFNIWLSHYNAAKEYYEENNNLLIPQEFVDKDGFKLGNWIQTQRQNYKNNKLENWQIELLELIEMQWMIRDKKNNHQKNDLLNHDNIKSEKRNMIEFLEKFKEFTKNNPEEAKKVALEVLIATGVLNEDGSSKEQIVTSSQYTEKEDKTPIKTLGSKPGSNK